MLRDAEEKSEQVIVNSVKGYHISAVIVTLILVAYSLVILTLPGENKDVQDSFIMKIFYFSVYGTVCSYRIIIVVCFSLIYRKLLT